MSSETAEALTNTPISTLVTDTSVSTVTAASELAEPILTAGREFILTGSALNPTNIFASAFESLHVLTGTSWPITIAIFTLALRSALFPFTVAQTRGSIRAAALRPQVEQLRSESMAYRSTGNVEKAKEKMGEMSALMKNNGIGIGRLLGLGFIPVPFFMSTFFALQKMTGQPIQSMLDGGALWFTDLCAADPYYILPALTTLTLLSTLEVSSSMNPASNTPAMKMFMRGMTLVSLPVTAFMPSAMVLYFVVSNTITTATQLMWKSPAIRRLFKIPPPPTQLPSSGVEPGFMETFKHSYNTALGTPTPRVASSVGSAKAFERNMRVVSRHMFLFEPENSILNHVDALLSGPITVESLFKASLAVQKAFYTRSMLHQKIVSVILKRPWSLDDQITLLSSSFREIFLQMHDFLLQALVDFFVVSFDAETRLLLYGLFKNESKRSIKLLGDSTAPTALWLKFALLKDTSIIVQDDPLMNAVIELYREGPTTSFEDINLDVFKSLKADVVLDLLLEFLESCDHVHLDLVLIIAECSMHPEQMSTFSRIIAKNSLMLQLSTCQSSSQQAPTIISTLSELNPLETVKMLEGMGARGDEIWSWAANWMARKPTVLNNVTPAIVERINGLSQIPTSFIISASLLNHEVVCLSKSKEFYRIDLGSLSFDQKHVLLLSATQTVLTTRRTSKLPYIFALVISSLLDGEVDSLMRWCQSSLTHVLFNAGISRTSPIAEFFGTAKGIDDGQLVILRKFLLDVETEATILDADIVKSCISLLDCEESFAKLTSRISFPALLQTVAPTILPDLISACCTAESSNFFPAGLERLCGMLSTCMGLEKVEAEYLAFLYEFGQHIVRIKSDRVSASIGLRILAVYSKLLNSSNLLSKMLSPIAEIVGVAQDEDGMAEELEGLVNLLLKQTDQLAYRSILAIIHKNKKPKQLTEDDIKALADMPWKISARYLLLADDEILSKLSSTGKEALHQILNRICKDCEDVELSLRLHSILKLHFPCVMTTLSSTSFERTPRVPEDLACFSQLYCIRFSIRYLKKLLLEYTSESDDNARNTIAYTIQRLCKFLGLGSQTSSVWDAFEAPEKTHLAQFLKSKYRFEASIEIVSLPAAIGCHSAEEWIWRIYSYTLLCPNLDQDTKGFMKNFAALMAFDGMRYFTIFSALVFAALVQVEGFGEALVQEYMIASESSSTELKSMLLKLFENIYLTHLSCIDGEVESSGNNLQNIQKLFQLLSASLLSSLACDSGDVPRAVRFLEKEYMEAPSKALIERIQMFYFSLGDVENGSGLADFFDPRDNKQLSYIMDSENNVGLSTELRLQEDQTAFDVTQLLAAASSADSSELVLELIHERIPKNKDFLAVLSRYEKDACYALGQWNILKEEYAEFSKIGVASPDPTCISIRWALKEEKVPLSLDCVQSEIFQRLTSITANSEQAIGRLQGSDISEIRFNLNILELTAREHMDYPKMKQALSLHLIKKMQHQGFVKEAFTHFLRLPDRHSHLLLESDLLNELGCKTKAIELLEFALDEKLLEDQVHMAHLRLALLKEESGHFTDSIILKHYEAAAKVCNDPEIYLKFAKYLDHDFGLLSLQEDEEVLRRAYLAVKNYSRAIMTKAKHDVEILPRLITIWLDICANQRKGGTWAEKLNLVIAKASRVIQARQFVRALPQLVSRIMHSNRASCELLHFIFSKIFAQYPHPVIWALIVVVKSSVASRQKRGLELLLKLRKDPSYGHLCKEYSNFADVLINFANYKSMDGTKLLSIAKDFPALRKALPADIQVPAALHLVDGPLVTCESVLDRVDVILSMQKPKKLGFRGSDGKLYYFLCKPNDDLRKDYRMVEIFDLVNDLYKQGDLKMRPGEVKLRKLMQIARFSVTALNEEAGLIEWVPCTQSFRSLILQYYKREGTTVSFRDIRVNFRNDPDPSLYFTNELLPRFPVVFNRWFFERFHLASEWIEARNSFAASSACISMLGFILGLGDRHGENILIDDSYGRAVHVDFNCLFEKGKTFEVPEIVPFRLTRNMLAGMGLAEWRGVFLVCAEYSMKLFKANKDLLMTNMESFVYDPMLEWIKSSKKASDTETINEQGLQIMKVVLEKISGRSGAKTFSSARGQVMDLIEEATDVQNLSRMYIGWSAFI